MDPNEGAAGSGASGNGASGNGASGSGAAGGGQGPDAGKNPPKPPPWQVPKPELHPELIPPANDDTDKAPGTSQPGTSQPGSSQPGSSQPGRSKPAPGHPLPILDPFAKEREREAAQAEARKKRSRRRTVVVGLGVTALLAGTITAVVASSEQEADYAQVCFNDETGERVDDSQCNNSSSDGRGSAIYAWYFYSRGASVPAVGQNRSSYPSYTKTVPQGAKTSTGYSTKGGTVSRGGFGSSSKSGGSSGG
ncbi:Tat pathway signal protein [Arthrobacter sp. StoSoilB13]|uniref:Tat pathway signal protein n=1 Tax=Arthrobacter sp. StoSoilB13 TaxID=2830993 RepID=UPI001CC45264|nr:Tat pathway signal protein [Arthrobacter sp. StoSoilB13]BCW49434.1 hypothetical protein StoSoilB13_17760 [Arthrobacter sp. StoSoilB13]